MEERTLANRDSSLDVIRIFAAFSVISVHFFSNSGFYNQAVAGKRMYLMVLIRTFFMLCVPMFMVLSGYLMNKKTLCKRYYVGLIKTINLYVLASAANVFFRVLKGESYSFKTFLFGLLDFSDAKYGWYVEMYIGLFLLIPFLNVIYHNLNGRTQKHLLLLTFLVLTALPMVTNSFNFTIRGWWSNPAGNSEYQKILPAWWSKLYPITYYFIGCYLSEYKVRVKNIVLLLLLAIHLLLSGSFNYYRSYQSHFIWGSWQDWGSVVNLITTVLVFLILKSIDTKRWGIGVKRVVKYIGELSLGTYLVSWIFDKLLYGRLSEWIPDVPQRMVYFLPMVMAVFVCSSALSALLNQLNKGMMQMAAWIKRSATKSVREENTQNIH